MSPRFRIEMPPPPLLTMEIDPPFPCTVPAASVKLPLMPFGLLAPTVKGDELLVVRLMFPASPKPLPLTDRLVDTDRLAATPDAPAVRLMVPPSPFIPAMDKSMPPR